MLKFFISFFLIFFSVLVNAHAQTFEEALLSSNNLNPRLKAERERLKEIDEFYVQARAEGKLNVNASSSLDISYTDASASSFASLPKAGQVNLVLPLYQGGRLKAIKSQAKAGSLVAMQDYRSVEQDVLLSAATAYINVMRDEEITKIRRNNVIVLTRQLEASNFRFDIGEGTVTDIAQSKARLANAEAGLATADAQLASSRAGFKRFVGSIPYDLAKPPTYILPPTIIEAKKLGRMNNPNLAAARYNEERADAGVNIAKSLNRPSLSLNGSLQGSHDTFGQSLRSTSASVGARLNIPIYQGGANRSRKRAAIYAKSRSRYETREIEMALDETIENIWAQLSALRLALAASREQVSASELAFRGVNIEMEVGSRNTLDVLNAEQELLEAKLTVVRAERDLNFSTYELLATLGAFDAASLRLNDRQAAIAKD